MFKFITNRPLWVNILAAIVLCLLLIFLFLKMLGWITNHGKYLTVPDIVGKKTEDAVKLLEKAGFDVEIQDSIFTDTAARGIVLKQLPDPNSTVKINRTVFLTVNRMVPPMIEMPQLEGQSLRFAMDMLERYHLKLGDTTSRPYFTVGAVLEQQYNGVRIPAKTKVQWGSTISLVIASGVEKRMMLVPSLVGLTYSEAKALLEQEGLSVAAIIPYQDAVIRDTASAFVVDQNPKRFDEEKKPRYIQSGQVMDVWLSPVMVNIADTTGN